MRKRNRRMMEMLLLRRGGAPSTFSPLDLSPALWLKADAGTWQDHAMTTTPAASDGDVVGGWEDQSGNGNNVIQATTAAKPTLQSDVGSLVNGLSVIRFDATDDYFGLGDFSALTAAEIFIVIKVAADPSAAGKGGIWNFGSHDSSSYHPHSGGALYDAFGTTARKVPGDPTTNLAAWHLWNVISVAGELTGNLNTAQEYTTGTNTVGFLNACTLGVSYGAQYLDGDIAEVILYNAKLSTANRASVETYLNGRYSIW